MEKELLTSIKNNEFIIYLQPKFDTITEKIVGAEALIRKMKNGKKIMPDKFIYRQRDGEYVLTKTRII